MTRGNLLHRIMEKVWDKLNSHRQLKVLKNDQLSALVLDQVHAAINEVASHYPQTFIRRFRSMEINRLHQQVLTWLELEKIARLFKSSRKKKI